MAAPSIDEVTTMLAEFISNNPSSSVESSADEAATVIIRNPWGDSTIHITAPDDYANLFAALNNVLLPQRFSALYHVDSRDFEIIFTSYPLRGNLSNIETRGFNFILSGKTYRCEYGQSSDRLIEIARNCSFDNASFSSHRNLPSFKLFASSEGKGEFLPPGSKPISFWIRDMEWNDENVILLCRHINFYMSYFDTQTPTVDIHPPKVAESKISRERFISGSFPDNIVGYELNSNLMHFWQAARGGDTFRRFLYGFQILEYASSYYVEDNVRKAIKIALSRPDILDRIDDTIGIVVDQVRDSKIWDGTRMELMLKDIVDAGLLWREIEKYKDLFSREMTFDGGFKIEALIGKQTSGEEFRRDWHGKISRKFRDIRNALSHGKERTGTVVIAPTAMNYATLRPWTELIAVAAGEVVVYAKAAG